MHAHTGGCARRGAARSAALVVIWSAAALGTVRGAPCTTLQLSGCGTPSACSASKAWQCAGTLVPQTPPHPGPNCGSSPLYLSSWTASWGQLALSRDVNTGVWALTPYPLVVTASSTDDSCQSANPFNGTVYARSAANASSSLTAEGVQLRRPCDNATLTPVCPSPPPPNPTPPPPPPDTALAPDGGFEDECAGVPQYAYRPQSATWAFVGGAGVIGPAGQDAFYSLANEGSCYGFLQGTGAAASANLTGLVPGARYRLLWAMKGRYSAAYNDVNDGNNDINVFINGAPLYSEVNVSSNGACARCWSMRESPAWVANASQATLTFTTTNPLGGDRTTFFDNIMLARLPPTPPLPPSPPNPPSPPPAPVPVPTNVSAAVLLVGSAPSFGSVVRASSAQLPAALASLLGANAPPVVLASLSDVARRRRLLAAASSSSAITATFVLVEPSLQAAQAHVQSLSAASPSAVLAAFSTVLPGLVSATIPRPPAIAASAPPARGAAATVNRAAAIGGGVGGGGGALCLLAAAAALLVREKRRREAQPVWDVFLSYRRIDAHVVDTFADKAALCGLRVFHDRSGAIVGRAFEAELFRAARSSVAFTPVITLAAIRGFGEAGKTGAAADYMLAECLIAMHFKLQGDHADGRTRLVYPVVVGPEAGQVVSASQPREDVLPSRVWQPLLHTAEYKAAVAALPDAVPHATVALVDGLCRRELGTPLAPALARSTVRQLLLGAPSADAQEHLPGLLGFDACVVEGPVLMLDAIVRGRFVPFVTAQLRPPPPSASKAPEVDVAARQQAAEREDV